MYANKLRHLDEMGKFLEKHNLPKLSLERIENMNSPYLLNKIEYIIKTLFTKDFKL